MRQLKQKSSKSKGKQKQDDEGASWLSIGPLGKLHNIAVYIRSSELLYNEWIDLTGGALGLDNDTRWNSWYDPLLTTSIKHRAALNEFCFRHRGFLGEDTRSPDDWETQ
jgi:hypothetical protein